MVFGNSITSGTGSEGPVAEWSAWSPCSPSQGTRSRTFNDGCTINCPQEEEECTAQGWSGWTRCSNRCGAGIKIRRWECGSDIGLHCNNTLQSRQRLACTSEEFCDFACNEAMIGDGYCDDKYNTDKCNFDGGDCCQPELDRTYCSECICYQTLADIQLDESSKCDFKTYVANGICEDFANTPDCNYDGGDCCGPSNYDYCGLCQCLFDEYDVLSTETSLNVSKCDLLAHAVGDGFCQDEVNNEDCNYDGGDCCNPNPIINLCQDCTCKNSSISVTGHHRIGTKKVLSWLY